MINAIIAGRAELRLYFYAALFRFKDMVFLIVKRERFSGCEFRKNKGKVKFFDKHRELKFKLINFTPPSLSIFG
jgi:hypothetical protein